MGLIIEKKQGVKRSRAFTHALADIPGGVCIATDELTQTTIPEGTAVGKDENGLYHIVKAAEITTAALADATIYIVKKGHNFKVGDFVMLKTSGKSYAITAIATNAVNEDADDITVATSLGIVAAEGDTLMQAVKAFQFQLVRLKSANASSTAKIRSISIPTGSIKIMSAEDKAKLDMNFNSNWFD